MEFENSKALLCLMNRLEIFPNLPPIVLVGPQGCGKSSVLESLVGKSFIPRGIGIPTVRNPVIIHLMLSDDNEEFCEVWSKEDKKAGEKFSVDELKAEIKRRTEKPRITEDQELRYPPPIDIRVHLPNVMDLNIVDLPGVAPIDDAPSEDIGDEVLKRIEKCLEKQMLEDTTFEHIRSQKAIILAVIPANEDIASSESLRLAQAVDPEGKRTFGVITKLDLLSDEGTPPDSRIVDILEGNTKISKLKRIIGVVNRSEQDLLDNKSIEDAVKSEREFFELNYPSLRGYVGSDYLAERLQRFLGDSIKHNLSTKKKRIDCERKIYEAELDSIGGEEIDDSSVTKALVMYNVTQGFIDRFTSVIKDCQRWPDRRRKLRTKVALEMDKIFEELQKKILCMRYNRKLLAKVKKQIRKESQKAIASEEQVKEYEDLFYALAREKFQLLVEPAVDCARKVHAKLEKIVDDCLGEDTRYEKLNLEIRETAMGVLASLYENTERAIKAEITYVGTDLDRSMRNCDAETTLKHAAGLLKNINMMDETNSATRIKKRAILKGMEIFFESYVHRIFVKMEMAIPVNIMSWMFFDCTVNGKLKQRIRWNTVDRHMELIVESEETRTRRIEVIRTLENLKKASKLCSSLMDSK